MAATDFRAIDTPALASSASIVFNKPTGTIQGDLMVALIVHHSSGVTVATATCSGWTLLEEGNPYSGGGTGQAQVFYKIAGASEPATYTFTLDAAAWNRYGAMVTYEYAVVDTDADSGSVGSSTNTVAPSITAGAAGRLICMAWTPDLNSAFTVPGSMTSRFSNGSADGRAFAWADKAISAGATGTQTFTEGFAANNHWGYSLSIKTANATPNAPTLVTPISATVIDKDVSNVFDWTFSDPDAGDSQSAYELQYRLVGAGSWTSTGQVTTTTTQRTITGGTLTAGNYEWQVRTWDALGAVGPFSSSAFFTAAATPATPTITSPTAGSTIASASDTVDWSAPSQTSYQVRKVADSAGSPDTGTVYYDSGEVVDALSRSAALTFPTNSRWEHIQVRIKASGLWSAWASVRVQVSYTPPATPTAVVTANTPSGAVTITATHPTPTGSQPTITAMDVYRREGSSGEGFCVAADVAPGGSFIDYAVASGVAYQYRVEDTGDNGTSTFSAWVS